ncbi:DUF397 domain-containing protein [Streptomyces sp. MBT42]|uniref:DUF397 domain-containing protein n=1 Tax=Streptomyces sp. MBT42 TaxID=1488373 RepID=UPI001E3D2DC4|nr:DUF397 domain-containing protein [Streptomyces sp. MBT42]MCD2463539.1 DUF397 domain-containing protein [Streptomyces sp. MBT42]
MSVEEPVPVVPESAWFKSSFSSGEGGECVEVAALRSAVHIRDSKDKTGPVLTVAPGAWGAFLGMVPPAGR